MAFESDLLSEVLDQEGLLGGYPEDVILAEFAVVAPDAFGGQPQPGAGARVAVVHEEAALLIPV